MKLVVRSIKQVASTIRAYELAAVDGGQHLPPFSAGAHLVFSLPNGMTRSYSLCSRPGRPGNYVVAVNRAPDSRGGSAYWFDTVSVGNVLEADGPKNNFPLIEVSAHTVLFAGGVGITPIWSMVQRLNEIGMSWELHYGARTPDHAAFLKELGDLAGASRKGSVSIYFDDAGCKPGLDMPLLIERAPSDSHFYCCGPEGMLEAFLRSTQALRAEHVHIERFTAVQEPELAGGFTVLLARTRQEYTVPKGRSILDVLLDAGVDVPHSCKEGLCASCETRVLEGVPEHRDNVLTSEEKASNKVMMLCCSGARTDRLVLDL